ncbi:nicotinate-nucleotide adenylyltransferase [Natronincola peptidivorans]|uniref:Probable nicotinate-nucleotide adenylyltransferase n=1 Tax=Natronincola peptidivorans TaxID=426128 RepID=A0A1H9YZC4_9FIRM|nr:nicotinate-nucleotide adenylyltransferase [Natronincola peptidivorans]SES74458.1 nicotinate-nucleotide adenylyltransferase [Natronincola peptidivorans]
MKNVHILELMKNYVELCITIAIPKEGNLMYNIEISNKPNKRDSGDKKYGIVGGTFDPIHIGHLFIGETALEQLNLDKIFYIPTGNPPHKDQQKVTSSYHRLSMTSLAIKNNPGFVLSEIEINRTGLSYTVDTIYNMLDKYGENVELYFIIGTDAFMEIETWKNYVALFNMIKIVVVTRIGFNNKGFQEKIQFYSREYNAEIIKMPIPILEISSSDIRERIKRGKSIKYLVSESVEAYIKSNKLYES